jgi:hypothetical protein
MKVYYASDPELKPLVNDPYSAYGPTLNLATDEGAALAQAAFDAEQEQGSTVKLASGGQGLIKRDCEHEGCGFQCEQAVRVDGFAI